MVSSLTCPKTSPAQTSSLPDTPSLGCQPRPHRTQSSLSSAAIPLITPAASDDRCGCAEVGGSDQLTQRTPQPGLLLRVRKQPRHTYHGSVLKGTNPSRKDPIIGSAGQRRARPRQTCLSVSPVL